MSKHVITPILWCAVYALLSPINSSSMIRRRDDRIIFHAYSAAPEIAVARPSVKQIAEKFAKLSFVSENVTQSIVAVYAVQYHNRWRYIFCIFVIVSNVV